MRAGASQGFSFWLSLIEARCGERVYACNARTAGLMTSFISEELFSRKGAKPQEKPLKPLCVFLCAFAPLRENFFSYQSGSRVSSQPLRFSQHRDTLRHGTERRLRIPQQTRALHEIINPQRRRETRRSSRRQHV